MARRGQAGFTLLELLLALALTALVALLAHTALGVALQAADAQRRALGELRALQQALDWLERDLVQGLPRPVADAWGVAQPALAGGEPGVALRLTRDGWDNPRGWARAELQRVHYQLDAQGRLWRRYWPRLDYSDGAEDALQTPLLDGVGALSIAFLDGASLHAARTGLGGEWRERWPLDASGRLPLAVMVTLETETYGQLRRVIELPAAP